MSELIGVRGVLKNKDIVSCLIPFLNIIDYINLRQAVPLNKSLISPTELLSKRFSHRIRSDLGLSEEVARALECLLFTEPEKRSPVYLTGGFLVALLRGDPFIEGQDVDLFYNGDELLHESFPKGDGDDTTIRVDTSQEYEGLTSIIDVKTNHYGQAKIQFINHIGCESALTSISRFDIPICRNAFNLQLGLRLCHNLEDLTRQQCTVVLSDWISRIWKLQYLRELKGYYTRLNKRVEKYQRRGFQIDIIKGDEESVRSAFAVDISKAPRIEKRDEVYRLMGKHNPDSCVYGKDCTCKSAGDTNARFCNLTTRREIFSNGWASKVRFCDCDHHMVFYREMKQAWVIDHTDTLWREFQIFWESSGEAELKKAKH